VFKNQTIRELSEALELSGEDQYESISRAPEQAYYDLSSAQKRLYIMEQMESLTTSYNVPMAFILEGNVQVEKIEQVLQQLIQRHASLRTSFTLVDKVPKQKIEEQVELPIRYYDEPDVKAEDLMRNFVQAFDLSQAPLIRVGLAKQGAEKYLFMIDMHHIITDGTSLAILIKEFMQLYSGLELKALPIQYNDFSEWQNKLLKSGEINKQKQFWEKEFKDEISVIELPYDYARPKVFSFEGSSTAFEFDTEITEKLQKICLREGKTMFMLLLAAYNVFLSKLSNQNDIIVGIPIAGRRHADLENMVGMFINTLIFRNSPSGDKTFKKFFEEVGSKTIEVFDNQDYQFEDLVGEFSLSRDASRNPIFDVAFSFHNESAPGNIDPINVPGLSLKPFGSELTTTKYDLTLSISETDDKLYLSFQYCTKLFSAETINRFISYFKQIVHQLSAKIDEKLSNLEIITEAEKQQLLYEFNNTDVDYERDKTICHLFDEQVAETPDNIAFVFGQEQLTYLELSKKANQLARLLKDNGVQPDSTIGIMLDYSFDMMISLLAVQKVGAAYLPVNPELPDERVQYLLNDSSTKTIISDKLNQNRFSKELNIINIEDRSCFENYNSEPINLAEVHNLAYLIYTSGSTGKPKGVLVKHKNIVNTLVNRKAEYALNSFSSCLQLFSFSFDGFVTGFFTPLISGSKLILLDKNSILDFNKIKKSIIKEKVTHFIAIPSLFNLILDTISENEKTNLVTVTLAGEMLNKTLLEKANDKLRNVEIAQEYGVTEAAVMSTICRNQNKIEKIVIGKPAWNTKIYILDKDQKLQTTGVLGELCISGEGVTNQYLKMPELTEEKFIPHPFIEGSILYRTGDIARWLPDGNIEFAGRIDHQVKIRGFRIELGEIENVLLNHECVKECVVIVREESGDKHLCSYIVYEKEIDQEELRTYLSNHLPDYMIPSYFVKMDTLPLTANGKVNRKDLPDPVVKAGDDYVAPSNELEKKMVSIWSEVLNVPEEGLSVMANFFALGGHSLKAMDVNNKIQEIFNVTMPLTQVLNSVTIRSLALLISVKIEQEENLEYDEVEF
jgi:amino acid adenylation domain-containing protein